MSFNGSGSWTAPAGNPVSTGTVIQTTWANGLVDDIRDTFNNVLPRDGQAPMAGALKLTAGTVGAPGLSFNAESSTGMYYPSSGIIALTALGVEVGRFKSTGSVLIGSTTDSGEKLQVTGTAKITGALTTGTVTTTGDLQLNNAQYVRGKIAAGTSTRMLGINASDVMFLGSVDAPISSMQFSNSGTTMATLSNNGLGIGMAATHAIDITKNQNTTSALRILNSDPGSLADGRVILSNGTNFSAGLILRGATNATDPNSLNISSGGTYDLHFFTGGAKRATLDTSGTLRVLNNVASTSTTTGALVVTGGAGISGAVSAGGLITSTQTSAGATVESLRLANAGAGGNTKARMNFYTTGTNYASITGGYGASSPELNFAIEGVTDGAFTWTSAAGERMRIGSTGVVTMAGGIASSSTTTGTLVVTGGAGVSGAINSGSLITGGVNGTSGTFSSTVVGANLMTGNFSNTIGYVQLHAGTATSTGYLEFFSTTPTRQGFIGFSPSNGATDTGTILYGGGTHAFGPSTTTGPIGTEKILAVGEITSLSSIAGTAGMLTGARSFIPTASGTGAGIVNFAMRTDATTYASAANIIGISDGAWTTTSSPGYLSFRTTASGALVPSERLKISSTGNVSIGGATTTALTKLDVGALLAAGTVADVALFSQNSSSNPTIGQGARIHLAANNSISRSASIEAVVTSGTNGHDLVFNTNGNGAAGTEKVRITTAGAVSINTPIAGSTALTVNGAASNNSALTIQGLTTTQATGELYIQRTGAESTSIGRGAAIQLANTTAGTAAMIQQYAGGLQLWSYSSAAWTERARLGADGQLSLYSGNLVLPKTTGIGIKVDPAAPTYPWVDLLGQIIPGGGGVSPAYNVVRNGLRAYQFTVNDEFQTNFHLPHDYAPGTDIYVHVHWLHASAAVTSGGVTWSFESTYAKGHNQAAFPASVTTSVTQTASTTQYQHMVAETVISQAGGSAALLNSTNFEPDGVIMVRCWLSGNTMNTTPEPYGLMIDLHYQSTGIGTKQKAPNFYV